MLKAHQACIDLDKNVLRIQGREVRFLAEHELPDKARDPRTEEELQTPGADGSGLVNAARPTSRQGGSSAQSSFPGSGNSLGSAPRASSSNLSATGHPPSRTQPQQQHPQSTRWPEKDIQALEAFGIPRESAIQALDAAGGNVEVAASLLF